MDWKFFVGLAVLIALVAGGWYLKRKQEQKLTAAKQAAANKLGLTYEREDQTLAGRYRQLLPFVDSSDRGHRAVHVLRGEFRDRPVTLFTYRYKERDTDSIGDNNSTRYVTREYGVVAVGLPAPLPELTVYERGFFGSKARKKGWTLSKLLGDEAARLLGGGAVETEDEAFDQEFVVKSPDPDGARRLLGEQTRAWLMGSEKARKYTVKITGDEIVTWGTGTEVAIGTVKADFLNDLLDQLPAGELWGPPPA